MKHYVARTLAGVTLVAALAIPISLRQASAAANVTLKVVKVDSEETSGEDGKGANAVDGDAATFWHTQWQDANPTPPHEITIELSRACTIKGFTYLPRQDEQVNGTIKDFEFYVSADGKEFGEPVKKGSFEDGKEKKTILFAAKPCRFIKLKAMSEINGQPWTSAAEIGIVRDSDAVSVKPKLKFVKVDSEETAGEDGKGANAVDGNPDTIWHTQWQDSSPAHPHEIVLQLDPPCKIRGFSYLPRQGDIQNGDIKDYEFFVSTDGKEFGQPVKKGSFDGGKDKKTVLFEAKSCEFVKLRALSEVNGEAWTSAAEIDVIAE